MNIFELLLSHIFGGNRAAVIEKQTAPVLVPLEATAASALETEVNSLINHNTGYAVQQISSGFDKIGLSGVDRTLAEAVVAGDWNIFRLPSLRRLRREITELAWGAVVTLPTLKMIVPAVAPSAGQKRLTTYIVAGLAAYVAGVQSPPHDAWGWVLFGAGLAGAWAVVFRAFLDQTLSRQSPPPDSQDNAQDGQSPAQTPAPAAETIVGPPAAIPDAGCRPDGG